MKVSAILYDFGTLARYVSRTEIPLDFEDRGAGTQRCTVQASARILAEDYMSVRLAMNPTRGWVGSRNEFSQQRGTNASVAKRGEPI
jgi:hypothetical protein